MAFAPTIVIACASTSSVPTSGPNTSVTAPQIASQPPFTSSQSQPVNSSTVTLPSASGYSGQMTLPVSAASLPANTVVAETASNVLPNTVPALFADRSAQSLTTQAGTSTAILFLSLVFSNSVTLPTPPSFTVTLPSAQIVSGVSYFLAWYDPLRPSVGWQRGFEGPGTANGATIAFSPGSGAGPYSFVAFSPQYFGLYAQSAQAPVPTPAPSVTPLPAPTAPPAFTLSPANLTLIGAGSTGTVAISDPTGCSCTYSATSASSSIATASVSSTTVTVSAVAAGSTTITVSSSDARYATLSVGITSTSVNVQGDR